MNNNNTRKICKKKSKYRLAIYLAAYDPYKDLFDIFIEQFKCCWPDCPYPLIISNMFFEYEGPNTIVIHNGNEKRAVIRKNKALDAVDADYYLGMEEDRILTKKVDTKEIERILDFMDNESIDYYRCNPSTFKKRQQDRFPGYDHIYHIPSSEPYGVCGSTVIMSKKLHDYRRANNLDDGYAWEKEALKKAYYSIQKWVPNYATDDRNLFGIVHCVEKQKWIASSRKKFIQMGYDIRLKDREVQTLPETIYMNVKDLGKRIPIKYRHVIKSFTKKLGFKFVTDY